MVGLQFKLEVPEKVALCLAMEGEPRFVKE